MILALQSPLATKSKTFVLANLPTLAGLFLNPIFGLGTAMDGLKVLLFFTLLVVGGDAYALWLAPTYEQGLAYPDAARIYGFTPIAASVYAVAFSMTVHFIAGVICGSAWRNRNDGRRAAAKAFVAGILYMIAVAPLFIISIELAGQIKVIDAKNASYNLTNDFLVDLKKNHPEIDTLDFANKLREESFNFIPKFK